MFKRSSTQLILALGVVGMTVLAGCSDDDTDTSPAAGGTAGTTAGTSGTSGTSAGSSGTSAGTSGTAGTGGTAGTAGTGGTAGTTAGSSGTGGTAGTTAGTAGTTAGSGGTAGTMQQSFLKLRFAHMGVGAPPIRICAAPTGETTFEDFTAGLTAGLAFGQVSAYQSVPVPASGSFDVKVVLASGDCTATGLLPTITQPVIADITATALISGDATAAAGSPDAIGVTPLFDNDADPTDGTTALRFVHAAPGTVDVTVGTYVPGTPPTWIPVFANVAYADKTSQVPGPLSVDSKGYVAIPASNLPLPTTAPFEVRVAANGARYATLNPPAAIAANKRVTVFAYGKLDTTTTPPSGVKALACFDGDESNGLTTCADMTAAPAAGVVPPGFVRAAHLSPDAGSVLVCAKPSGYPTWLAAADASDAESQIVGGPYTYKDITGNLPLPSDGYDFRIVAGDAADCATSLAETSAVTLGVGQSSTVAAIGLTTAPPAGQELALKSYVNDDTAPAGQSTVRFVNVLSEPNTLIDFGTVTVGGVPPTSTINKIYVDIDFGKIDTATGSTDGYRVLSVSGGSLLGIDNDFDAPPDLVATVPPTQGTALNQTFTYWAIGAQGNASNPPALLFCRDSESATSPTLTCTTIALVSQ